MLHKASKTALIHLLLFIFLSENVLFYTILCADIEYENSDDDDNDDYFNDKFENITENYSDIDIEDYNDEHSVDNYKFYKNDKFNNKDETTIYQRLGNYGGVRTGELKEEKLQVIKGHYTEKFKQDLPGGLPPIDVIRNVGYIADEKGYQPFIINYTIDDHRSDTEPHYDTPFGDDRRRSEEYKTHYKPQEQFSKVKLPDITKQPLITDQSGNYKFGFHTLKYGRAESSETINQNTENETRIVKGQYSNIIGNRRFFVKQTIGYTADKNGFQPFLIDSYSNRWPLLEHFEPVHHYDSDRLAEDVSVHFKPLEDYKNVKLPTFDDKDQNKSTDGYQFSFNSGTYNRSEISEIKNKGTENEISVIKGQYTEKIKNERGEAVIRHIGYVADERGYQPFIIKSYIENPSLKPPLAFTVYPDTTPPPPGSPKGKGIGSLYVNSALAQLG